VGLVLGVLRVVLVSLGCSLCSFLVGFDLFGGRVGWWVLVRGTIGGGGFLFDLGFSCEAGGCPGWCWFGVWIPQGFCFLWLVLNFGLLWGVFFFGGGL